MKNKSQGRQVIKLDDNVVKEGDKERGRQGLGELHQITLSCRWCKRHGMKLVLVPALPPTWVVMVWRGKILETRVMWVSGGMAG